MKDMKVLVTGATGQQGGAVARALVEQRYRVRAVTRLPVGGKPHALARLGVQIVVGDFDVAGSLRDAAADVDAVFLMGTPFERGTAVETRQGIQAVDAFVDAGVGHIVYSSASDADRRTGVPHFESKRRVEEHLRAARCRHTIVAPTFLRENLLNPLWRDALLRGHFAMALRPDRPLQNISVDEVGRFVAHVIEHGEEFAGTRVNLASDENPPVEIARHIGETLGRDIRYTPIPLAQLEAQSPDFARLFDWLDRVGHSADIHALRRMAPKVGWQDLATWARQQEWHAVVAPMP